MSSLLVTFALLFSTFLQPVSAPDQQETSSTIEQATVFLSGAQVTRTAEVELAAGTNQLTFTGLSSSLDERSITLSTDHPITLLSLQKRTHSTQSSPLLDSLRTRLDEINGEIKRNEGEVRVLEYEHTILMENRNLKGDSQNISALQIKQAMDYFREKLTEIENGKIELKDETEELNRERTEINNRINEIRQQQNQRSAEIHTEIESGSSQTVAFEISYFVSRAGWHPSYDVRVQDIANPLELIYKANVWQSTGIDWNDVNLEISSAQPRSSTDIPELQPSYLNFYSASDLARNRNNNAPMAEEGISPDAELSMAKQEARPVQTSTNYSQTAFSFTIQQPYTIPGDGSSKTVAVNEYELPATYRYYAIPKVRQTAYLTAMLTDWEDLNLLPGQTNLYFDQTFVGQSSINPTVSGDTLRFSLGQDQSITVERNRMEQFSERNFFGNRVTETRAWELVVKNNKNRPIDLELLDQIPVSTNEDIEVTLENRSGGVLEEETGRITWILELQPGGTQTRQLRYSLEYPSGRTIQERN